MKKIEAKLGPMEEVAAVRCDTESKTVTVVPKPDAKVSPPRSAAVPSGTKRRA